MHIHILGICGTFMGGIAAIASRAGHKVTGCDANVYPPMSDQLRALGIDLIQGYDSDQLKLKPDIWLIGNVVSRGNPLMEAIMAAGGQHYMAAPQWLYEHVLVDKWVAAVAGTHGKTTTTALLTWVLDQCGCEPGFLVGGVPGGFDVSARLTDSIHFVIEADEYDTAFFDKRSKFVHYHPRTVILNNLEFDHADIFPDLAAIETQFHHLVRAVPNNGLLVVNGQAPALDRVLERGCWSEVSYFDRTGNWHARYLDEQTDALAGLVGSRFEVHDGKQLLGVCTNPLAGAHNRSNALAVIAAAKHMGVRPADAIKAIGLFPGVKRRLETRGVVRGVTVIDDFAHHPTAFTVTINALRERMGTSPGRILAVLEPRSNTMKQGVMKSQLAGSLSGADKVFCYAGGVTWDVAQTLAPLGEKLVTHIDIDQLTSDLLREAQAGDILLVMSNGAFGGIHQKLLVGLAS
jgi:UDP-N-acetylmuramate: L-alanyl-gamma-D-glutamyl-meso-diaminopimelate ligase